MACCIKLLGTFNLLLGLVSLLAQILSLIGNGDLTIKNNEHEIQLPKPTDNYGAGVWCGVVFILVGFAAFKHAYTITSTDKTWKIILLVMAVLGVVCGVAQVTIAGLNMKHMKSLPDLESNCSKTPQSCHQSLCENPIANKICNTNDAYQVTLISGGNMAIVTNLMLILATTCNCC